MPKFLISATKVAYYIAEVEADDADDARQIANGGGGVDWERDHATESHIGDDYEVIDVQPIDGDDDDNDEDDDEVDPGWDEVEEEDR